MAFSYEELENILFQSNDHFNSKKVFLELLEKAKKNDLTYIESKFFCTILNHTYIDYGKQIDFSVCEEHLFNSLYKIFYKDLSGSSKLINKWGNIISDKEKEDGLEKLNSFFLDWEKTINSNSKDNLIKEIKRETKREIKLLRKKSLFNNMEANLKNDHKILYQSIILRSRFLRNIALEHIERFNSPIIINFNNKDIEFNEFSLAHIYFRHYAEIIKQVELDKSFHFEIEYTKIGTILKYILEEIYKSMKFIHNDRQIRFKYNSQPYSIWISPEKEKSIKGTSGMIKYYQIETFYPLTETSELEKLNRLKINKINEKLELFN